MLNNFFTVVQSGDVSFVFKLGFSILVFLYTIFLIFVANQVHSLNRLIFIRPANTSTLLFVLAIVQVVISFFLFLATLAIL